MQDSHLQGGGRIISKRVNNIVMQSATWRRPWVVHGAYDSDVTIHSRTFFWYKERTAASQAGSLTTVGVSL